MIYQGDSLEILKTLPSESVDCIVTSPPYYGLRDYGAEGQVGMEPTLEDYLAHMLLITAELKRVLKKTGTMWWNHGDSYSGSWGNYAPNGIKGIQREKTASGKRFKRPAYADTNMRPATSFKSKIPEKSLILQAYRLAIRMVDEQGWILRNEIIWHKPNCMPSSVKDRFTVDFEPIFFFSKSGKYYFEQQHEPLAESTFKDKRLFKKDFSQQRRERGYNGMPQQGSGMLKPHAKGRNKRAVWCVSTKPFKEAHFAVYPQDLIETPILAGSPIGGVVLDPFFGSGTTGMVAKKHGREFIGIEINPAFVKMAEKRLSKVQIALPL